MEGFCEICGAHDSKKNPVRTFNGVGGDGAGTVQAVRLCQRCTVKRQVASWPRSGRLSQWIHEALRNHAEAIHGRYAYLDGPFRLHLLRLRPDWIHEHAATS